jgi:hypothetical protein
MTNHEKIKSLKDQVELIPTDNALQYITNQYKYDKITYSEFVTLLNFIQRHETDFKYE